MWSIGHIKKLLKNVSSSVSSVVTKNTDEEILMMSKNHFGWLSSPVNLDAFYLSTDGFLNILLLYFSNALQHRLRWSHPNHNWHLGPNHSEPLLDTLQITHSLSAPTKRTRISSFLTDDSAGLALVLVSQRGPLVNHMGAPLCSLPPLRPGVIVQRYKRFNQILLSSCDNHPLLPKDTDTRIASSHCFEPIWETL